MVRQSPASASKRPRTWSRARQDLKEGVAEAEAEEFEKLEEAGAKVKLTLYVLILRDRTTAIQLGKAGGARAWPVLPCRKNLLPA